MKFQRRGVDLAYDVRGEGPLVLLLHAFPFDRRMWQDTAEALAARHRVATLDFRGFGESSLGAPPPSLEDLAEDVASLLDTLGAPMATLAGLSMGGYVALAFARRHPARLAALALCDTRAGADGEAARQARQDGIRKLEADGVAEFLDGMPLRLLSRGASDLLRRRVRLLSEQRPHALIAALAAMRDRPDRTAELAEIRCPTLVLVGAEDTVTPPSEAETMAQAIPGSRLAVLPGAGHLSNLEVPAAFEAALTQFLDENL
jgi:pimeloyl-ACP methyl ester carboxylesterase